MPANKKRFTRIVVAAAVIDGLVLLDLKYPKVGDSKLKIWRPHSELESRRLVRKIAT